MDVISGFNVHAPHLIDRRAGPYQSVSDALAAIPMNGRREGLTVVITGNPQQEYWWKDGISDAHLQLKTGGSAPQRYNIGDGVNRTIDISIPASDNIVVQVYDTITRGVVYPDWIHLNNTTVRFVFEFVPTVNQFFAIIVSNVTNIVTDTIAPKPSLKYVLNNVQSIVITHGLQDYPTVVVLDNNMRQVFCDVSYIDLDNVSLSFSMFFNGLAVLTN